MVRVKNASFRRERKRTRGRMRGGKERVGMIKRGRRSEGWVCQSKENRNSAIDILRLLSISPYIFSSWGSFKAFLMHSISSNSLAAFRLLNSWQELITLMGLLTLQETNSSSKMKMDLLTSQATAIQTPRTIPTKDDQEKALCLQLIGQQLQGAAQNRKPYHSQ